MLRPRPLAAAPEPGRRAWLKSTTLAAGGLLAGPWATAAAQPAPGYARRPEVAAFIADVAQRRQLPPAWLQQQLAQARRAEGARRLIMPPPSTQPPDWDAHRARFVEPARVAAGVAFWQQHRRWLAAAETRYGVADHILVGILGVETYWGRITGRFRILDALATLSFDFPAGRSDRSAFFRGELEEFLVLCAREGLDPQAQRGSFAGAMGLPQFMPGSINRWAVDFDDDGHVDLLGSAADALGSVGHYLARHGWHSGLPVFHAVTLPADEARWRPLAPGDVAPRFTPAQFADAGIELPPAAHAQAAPLVLVELRQAARPSLWVAGTANLQAITRYNFSRFYAMAVAELGAAVAAQVPPSDR